MSRALRSYGQNLQLTKYSLTGGRWSLSISVRPSVLWCQAAFPNCRIEPASPLTTGMGRNPAWASQKRIFPREVDANRPCKFLANPWLQPFIETSIIPSVSPRSLVTWFVPSLLDPSIAELQWGFDRLREGLPDPLLVQPALRVLSCK